MKLRILTPARKEAEQAVKWYDRERAGLGTEFADSLQEVFENLARHPLSFPEYPSRARNLRWCKVGRFSYLVFFEVRSEEVLVKAVSHASRRPGYWRRRKG